MLSRQAKKDYRLEAFPMLFLALGLTQAGIAAMLNPEAAAATSVATLLSGSSWHFLEYIWQVSYIAAGLYIAIGVLKPWPVLEVLGEWLAMWAMLVNLAALLIIRGPAGTGATLGAFLFAVAVCAVRIHRLHLRAQIDRRFMPSNAPYDGPERRKKS